MLPSKMDRFMVSVEPTKKSIEISETAKSREAIEEISGPQSEPEQK